MIIKANKYQLPEIIDCLSQSKLKEAYFYDVTHTEKFFDEAMEKEELYVYMIDDKVIGFIRVDNKGMLSRFPLLRCISIHPEYRSRGYGSKLLQYFIKMGHKDSEKIYLCVSDFNPSAFKLYTQIGFRKLGEIEDLYKPGITEYLLYRDINC